MKTTKLWSIIIMLVFLIGTAVALSSCSKDDEITSKTIVGTWSCTGHYYGGTDTFVFKNNGTYTWSYNGSANWFPDDSGNYAYDSSRSTLTIHNKKGTTWVYIMASLTSSSFTIIDEDGHTYYYSKK